MKKKVLVIFGSMSSEHEISCISAANVVQNIDKEKYDIYLVGIDKEGKWYRYNGSVDNIANNCWIDDLKHKEYIKDVIIEVKKYDVIFPVLHGKYGEDGSIQGLLEMAKAKYVGCKILGSSIAINKTLSKELVKSIGIDIVPYIAISTKEFHDSNFSKEELYSNVEKNIGFPVIVKPNSEGSSYGVTKAEKENELYEAIKVAFKYDDDILIEKFVEARKEVECAILEDKGNDKVYASTPGEIVSANEFYDFDAKYKNEKSYVNIPAKISKEKIDEIKYKSKQIFDVLRLDSIARVDFFVTHDKVYFNEVNTMPGFTNISMYPMMLEYDGLSYSRILDILIEDV